MSSRPFRISVVRLTFLNALTSHASNEYSCEAFCEARMREMVDEAEAALRPMRTIRQGWEAWRASCRAMARPIPPVPVEGVQRACASDQEQEETRAADEDGCP